MNKFKLRYKTH